MQITWCMCTRCGMPWGQFRKGRRNGRIIFLGEMFTSKNHAAIIAESRTVFCSEIAAQTGVTSDHRKEGGLNKVLGVYDEQHVSQ